MALGKPRTVQTLETRALEAFMGSSLEKWENNELIARLSTFLLYFYRIFQILASVEFIRKNELLIMHSYGTIVRYENYVFL
jgi:hypothetical protein